MRLTSKTIDYAVPTINDFPTTDLVDGQVVVVSSDGGRNGTFVYDTTQAAVNNGGTIFDGWVRQYDGAVNVKWFGAKGDGDDISSLLTDIMTNLYSGTIFIPNGTYKVANVYIRPSFIILGESKHDTVIESDSTSGNYTIAVSQPYSSLQNLTIDGTNSSGFGVWVNGPKTVDIRDIRIIKFTGSAIGIDGIGLIYQNTWSHKIVNSEISEYRVCALLRYADGEEVNVITFDNCTLESSVSHGVIVDNGTNISFKSCSFANNGNQTSDATILINDTAAVVSIDNCWFETSFYSVDSSGRNVSVNNSHLNSRATFRLGNGTVTNSEFFGYGGIIETPTGSTATVIEQNNVQSDGHTLISQIDGIISSVRGNNVEHNDSGITQSYKCTNTGLGQSTGVRYIGGGNDTLGPVLKQNGSGENTNPTKAYINNELGPVLVVGLDNIDRYFFAPTTFASYQASGTAELGDPGRYWGKVYSNVYYSNGLAGVSGTFASPTSITLNGGIVTAIS